MILLLLPLPMLLAGAALAGVATGRVGAALATRNLGTDGVRRWTARIAIAAVILGTLGTLVALVWTLPRFWLAVERLSVEGRRALTVLLRSLGTAARGLR